MSGFPCVVRLVSRSGGARYRLGHPLVDRYLEFVAGRARPNTLRAVAFDLKTFFTVVNRPGEPGDSLCWLTGLGEGGVVTVVDVFEFSGRNVPTAFEQAPMVVPVGPVQRGHLDLFGGAPGPAGLDQLGLV